MASPRSECHYCAVTVPMIHRTIHIAHLLRRKLGTRQRPTSNEQRSFSDWLKDEIEEANPLADKASAWADIMGAAVSSIIWYELAET
jgi:hypothetical protein